MLERADHSDGIVAVSDENVSTDFLQRLTHPHDGRLYPAPYGPPLPLPPRSLLPGFHHPVQNRRHRTQCRPSHSFLSYGRRVLSKTRVTVALPCPRRRKMKTAASH